MARTMKDSGIEWIGEIPEEWEALPTKRIFNHVKRIVGKSSDQYDRLSLTMNGVLKREKTDAEGLQPADFETYQILLKNELVFKLIDLENIATSRVGYSPYDGIVSSAYIVLSNPNQNNMFYYYYFISLYYRNIFNTMGQGVRSTLSARDLINKPFIKPPISEQQAIADFLDIKCNLIDSTIEKQKAVIEKLKYYKQSQITEAVTKGLDPTAKMKPSGIEWIGYIPEGWEVRKLKYLGDLNSNGIDKKNQDGEETYKSVHYMNVYNNSLSELKDSEDYLIISANDSKANSCTLEKGDVLFTNSSETPDDMGHSTVVCETLDNTLFGYHLMRFRPRIEIYLQFEKYLFGSYYMRKWFEYRSIGMTRYGISYSEFAEALIILPKLKEQQGIADYLDSKCAGIENAIVCKQKLIEKLTAYKKSLIYECVTGKREV